MNEEQWPQQVRRATNQLAAQLAEYEGYVKLFESACLIGNGQQAEEYRQRIHSCTDAILDCRAGIASLIAQQSR